MDENSGQRTAGIDGQSKEIHPAKFEAIAQLQKPSTALNHSAPHYIPKLPRKETPSASRLWATAPCINSPPYNRSNIRNISRCHLLWLRPYCCCADAIARCFDVCQKDAPNGYWKAVISSGFFGQISHHDVRKYSIGQNLGNGLKQVILKTNFFPSEAGTPQGAIISPCLT